jgi:hypothetical protein
MSFLVRELGSQLGRRNFPEVGKNHWKQFVELLAVIWQIIGNDSPDHSGMCHTGAIHLLGS